MRVNVIAFSTNGCRTATDLKGALSDHDVRVYSKTSSANLGVERVECSLDEWTKRSFEECDAIVFIGALGICVRHIAPYLRNKTVDPAVIGMDELGKWTIPLLSGHIGGANELAVRIATRMGSEPIVTTATDLNGKFSVDTFAARNGMHISSMRVAKDFSARVLDGRFVGFCSDIPVEGTLPNGIVEAESGEFGACISSDPERRPFDVTLNLIPRDVVLGIGCRRDTDPSKLEGFVSRTLKDSGVSRFRVSGIASIDLKADEPAILELASRFKVPVSFYSADELNSLEGGFTQSEFVSGITGVDCVCERSAVMAGCREFLLRKTSENGMTMAICSKPVIVRFL